MPFGYRSFANRNTSAFISPEECETLEHWAGKSVLTALANINIPEEVRFPSPDNASRKAVINPH